MCVFQCDIDMLICCLFSARTFKINDHDQYHLGTHYHYDMMFPTFSTRKSVPTFIFQPYIFAIGHASGHPPCFIQVPKVYNNPFPLILNTPLEIMV